MARLLPALALSLAACTRPVPSPSEPVEPSADDTDVPPEPEVPCEAVGRSCLVEGTQRFEHALGSHRVLALFPEVTENAPVVFLWHYFEGSPSEVLHNIPIEPLVDEGFILVAPKSHEHPLEWDVLSPEPENADLVLFDALVESAVDDLGADPDRIYAAGSSAGGLFTSYLTVHRAGALAATAPISGGIPARHIVPLDGDVDAFITWGGVTDFWSGFYFHRATLDLRDALLAAGQTVQMCNHHNGHRLPEDAAERIMDWFSAHAATGQAPLRDGCEWVVP